MRTMLLKSANALAAALALLFMASAQAQTSADAHPSAQHDHSHDHDHDRDHAHSHGHDPVDKAIYKGHFEDSQIAARPLSDWEGDWQSVYPHLQDGTLDPVMAHKAEHGDKTAQEYREYYENGYRTDVDRIVISGHDVTFHKQTGVAKGHYVSDGFEILTYAAGNRGVRFIFKKTGGDAEAPRFIQFSDHRIAPAPADHYHLYWGDDRSALLEQLSNWPTYYPSSLNGDQIAREMMAH